MRPAITDKTLPEVRASSRVFAFIEHAAYSILARLRKQELFLVEQV
jgi:hypothetical protein